MKNTVRKMFLPRILRVSRIASEKANKLISTTETRVNFAVKNIAFKKSLFSLKART